jgi:hypothetical protein
MQDLEPELERLLDRLAELFRQIPARLAARLATTRSGSRPAATPPVDFPASLAALNQRVSDLSHFRTRPAVVSRIESLHQLVGHTRMIDESAATFAEQAGLGPGGELAALGDLFHQALEALLFTAAEALQGREPEQIATLRVLTGDRREVMARIRDRYFAAQTGLPEESRHLLFEITNTFARIAYFLNAVSNLLRTWKAGSSPQL